MNKILPLIFVLVFISFSFGQTLKTKEIKQINSYVKNLYFYIDNNKKKLEIYADVSENSKSVWRKFGSEKTFEKFRDSAEIYNSAYVWRKNNKVVAVNFTFSSSSGDWVHYVFYRFREDGTLAKIEAELRTFYGNMDVVRDFYFDKNGKLLKKTIQYRDLESNKLKKPGDDFSDNKVIFYKTTKKLPFIKLLK